MSHSNTHRPACSAHTQLACPTFTFKAPCAPINLLKSRHLCSLTFKATHSQDPGKGVEELSQVPQAKHG